MRFKRVEIPAYGPFTGFEITLPREAGDFHLIYGCNEAGKSSLLRALRGLLFGIPGQSADNFLHDYKQLRIAAELEREDGTTRLFQRRKGNKNTLLDAGETAIAEAELGDFLGSVDENYFDGMFGLGAEELRRGADQLLRGEGRLGEALFSASLGGTPVDRVIQSLQAEAARFFSGRARKGISIREACRELADHRRLAKEALIKPEAWEEVEREIREHGDRRRGLISERKEKTNRKSWLERCRDALPLVGQLSEARQNLRELPELPELAESFAEEIRAARQAWQDAGNDCSRLERQIDGLREQAQGCRLAPAVLAEETSIDALHSDLGVYQDNKTSLAAKVGKADQLKAKVLNTCRDLGIDAPFNTLDDLRVSEPEFLEVQARAAALEEAEARLGAAHEKRKTLQGEIRKLRAARPAETSAKQRGKLERAVREAGLLEAVAAALGKGRSEAEAVRISMEHLHRQLTGTPDDHEVTRKLVVPQKSSIEKFRAAFDEIDGNGRKLDADRLAKQGEIDELDADIKRLERQRDLPGLDDLHAAREHRDRGWDLVLEDWKGAGAGGDLVEGKSLEEAYPEAVASADAIADRLRVEAEAVAQIDEKRSQREVSASFLDGIAARQEELGTALESLTAEWRKEWKRSGIDPVTPPEMSEWRDQWVHFGTLWDQWTKAQGEISENETAISQAASRLASVVGSEKEGFLNLLAAARKMLKELGEAAGAAQALERQIGNKEGEGAEIEMALPSLEEAADRANRAWAACRDSWSLPKEVSSESALGLLRSRREMFGDHGRWSEIGGECEELKSSIATFEKRADALVLKLGLDPGDPEKNEATAWIALQAAQAEQLRFEGYRGQITADQQDLELATRTREAARQVYDVLLARTRLSDETALDNFLRQFTEKTGWQKRILDQRNSLAGFARAEPVDAFIARVESEEADALDGSVATLEEEIAVVETEIEEVNATLHEWERKRREMEKADDSAARHAQLGASAAARIRHDAERFVRLQLSVSLLESQIDRFREENQGPFMEKAGAWFSRITGNSFVGITTSYDAGDDPVIAGVRSDGSSHKGVRVDAMSEGTRDQLYLALRLAGLELHLAEHEPMPMILDDLLVHFDDTRARHALAAMSTLGRQSQVLLFTHHAHLVGLAREELGDERVHLHEL